MLPGRASTFGLYNPASLRLYLPTLRHGLLSSDAYPSMSGILAVLLSVRRIFSTLV
jgi:hypothetical protein